MIALTVATGLAMAASAVVVIGAIWGLGVYVFQPRMKDTIEHTIKATVNGKIDRLETKVDKLGTDAQERHTETEARLAVGAEKMQRLRADFDRLAG